MSTPWEPELDVPEPLARQLIDRQFPEFASCPLQALGEGWDNIAWQAGPDWVFRFPRRQLGADLIRSELAVMPRIADRLQAPVACPLRHGRPDLHYPWPFAGYRMIHGMELCEAAPEARQRLRLAEELGEFLKSLHSVTAVEALQLGAPRDMLGRLNIEKRSTQAIDCLTQAAESGLIDSPEPWKQLLNRLIPACRPPATACLVHGDLYSRHIIVHSGKNTAQEDSGETRLAGIIDWGDLHAGDPSADLACIWSLFDSAGRQRLLKHYGSVPAETLALSRLRAIAHSSICVIYGRQGNLPALEQAAKDGLYWLLDD